MERKIKSISAILLAAGESKRLGGSKLLLPLGEKTILETAVDHLLDSQAAEVIVVVGHKADEMKKILEARPVKVVFNSLYRNGMSTSIAQGLEAVGEKASGVLIALADQPHIEGSVVNQLIEKFLNGSRGIICPIYQGVQGHPVIFSMKYKGELLKLQGDTGGREIMNRHRDDVLEVAIPSPYILTDIDTQDDYRLYLKSLKRI